jgi:hypothetical protein
MYLNLGRVILIQTAALCVLAVSLGRAQEPAGTSAGPSTAEPRFSAPFSATVVTTVVQRTPDGGRVARKMVAKYYRDSFGRERVEYAPNSNAGGDTPTAALVMPNPYAPRDRVFLVDDAAKIVELTDHNIIAASFNGVRKISVPTALRRFTDFPAAEIRHSGNGLFENLGSREFGVVEANGVRFTTTLSKAMSERWLSPELGFVVHAREVDPERGWDIEYTLRDIQRTEPPQELFVMPVGYKYVGLFASGWRFESPEAELRRMAK